MCNRRASRSTATPPPTRPTAATPNSTLDDACEPPRTASTIRHPPSRPNARPNFTAVADFKLVAMRPGALTTSSPLSATRSSPSTRTRALEMNPYLARRQYASTRPPTAFAIGSSVDDMHPRSSDRWSTARSAFVASAVGSVSDALLACRGLVRCTTSPDSGRPEGNAHRTGGPTATLVPASLTRAAVRPPERLAFPSRPGH